MRSDYKHLLINQEDAVVTITMNRPEVLNAFNELMLQELIEAVDAATHDEHIRCLVLTGAGRAFGAGQDLAEFSAAHQSGEPIKVSDHLKQYHRLLYSLHEMPKPVIAALHGVTTGVSANIALSCDIRIAADNLRFSQAFAKIGLIPDGGGGYFLPRLVGLGRALEIAMLAEEINGQEAERIGLVNKCVPFSEFVTETHRFAQRLAQGPTRAYAYIKELMYKSLDLDLQSCLTLEGKLQDMAIQTSDHREGLQAFQQKRSPRYSGS